MSKSTLLEVRHLTKSFGALRAVDDVNFSIDEGSIVGLIGPNGSGKSTLFNLLGGYLRADSGEVYFAGRNTIRLRPNDVSALGLVKGFQTPRNFKMMTVMENILLSPKGQKGEIVSVAPFHRLWSAQEEEIARNIMPWLDSLKLLGNAADRATELSGGQMKLLDILRGMMATQKLLLLDEPTAGVAPGLADEIFQRIVEIRSKTNTGFFIIEHKVETLLRFVDRVMVMHLGKLIYDGPPNQVVDSSRVKEVYLGQ